MPMRRFDRHRPARGFTLIELVVTLTIVGVLASVALPLIELTIQRSKEQELRASLRQIRTAIDEYKKAVDEGRVAKRADDTGYPPNLELLVNGVPDAKDSNKRKQIYFMRRLPRDPFQGDPSVPAHATWGKRSYESGPDNPQEGRDVFDVYSRAEGVGLNGVPYRQW